MTPSWRRGMAMVTMMAILIGIGWVMVFSTSAILDLVVAQTRGGRGVFHHLGRQILATGLGALAIWAIVRLPVAEMERWALHALAGTGALMLAVFIPGLGHTVGHATRWLVLGQLSFQPVEPFKLAVVLCYTVILAGTRPQESWPGVAWLKLGGLAAIAVVLPLVQRDFGSAALLMALGFMVVWLAGGRARYLAVAGGVGLALAVGAIAVEPYRLRRITDFVSHLTGGGGAYQTRQSLIALGAGGVFGRGLGESIQKLYYLPSSHADFIFAILCEELGFLFGGLSVIMLFVFLLREGTGIARAVNGRLAYLLASGMAFLIFMQAMWHIAVVLVLVPTKGLALPFISYGGSSLIASMMAVGIILRCAAEPAAGQAGQAPRVVAWTPSS